MKSKPFRLVLTAFTICALTAFFPSCGDSNNAGSGGGTNTSAVENNCYETGFPIAKDPVTLKVLVRDYTGLPSYDEITFVKEYEKLTNVKIQWDIIQNEDCKERLLLCYMTDSLPDIAMGIAPYSLFQQWQFFEQGMVTCAEPYLQKYGKNILAALSDYDMAKYNATMPDGKIWTIPALVNQQDTGSYYERYLINTKWLETLGLEMPKTTKQLRDVLVAFRDGDPNGNGTADEIPFSISTDLLSCAFSPFGISNAAYEYRLQVHDDYKLEYTPVTEAYKKALSYYASLFSEGLLDNKWARRTAQDLIDLVNSSTEKVGMFGAWGVSPVGSMDVERQWNDYAYLPPLSDGDTPYKSMMQVHETSWAEWYIITSECKYPEIAVRWADFLFTPEGQMWKQYGAPSEKGAWHKTDGGKFVLTMGNLPQGMTQTQWLNSLTPGHPLPGGLSDAAYKEYHEKLQKKPESEWTTYEKVANRDLTEANKVFDQFQPKNVFPRLNYETTDQDFMTNNAVAIYGLSDTYRREVLNGTRKLESTWDQYVKDTYERGLEKYMTIQQTAYDKYRAFLAGQK